MLHGVLHKALYLHIFKMRVDLFREFFILFIYNISVYFFQYSIRFPTATFHDILVRDAVELEMLEEKLKAERYKRMKVFEKISEQINKLEDQNEIDVLFYRYIRQLDWWKIAERMNYTERHIHRIHGEALVHFELPEAVIECQ